MLQLEQANQALEREICAHRQRPEALLRRQEGGRRACRGTAVSGVARPPLSTIDGHVADILKMVAEFVGVESAMVVQISPDLTKWGAAWAGPCRDLKRRSESGPGETYRGGRYLRSRQRSWRGEDCHPSFVDDLPAGGV